MHCFSSRVTSWLTRTLRVGGCVLRRRIGASVIRPSHLRWPTQQQRRSQEAVAVLWSQTIPWDRHRQIERKFCTIVGGVVSPLWSNIFLTPFDRAMTEAGYRLTRWADDFVVICKTRQEAEAALALADRFLRETLGISLHPEKTRIVHVDHGFEFLGYKVKQGPGLRLPAYKRKTVTNPHNLYAVPA